MLRATNCLKYSFFVALLLYSALAYTQGKTIQESIQFINNSENSDQSILLELDKLLGDSIDEMDFESAIKVSNVGLEIAKDLNSDSSIAFIYTNIGYANLNIERLSDAKENYLLAIEYFDHIPVELHSNWTHSFEAMAYQGLGVVNDIQGYIHSSLKNYLTAIEIYELLNDSSNIADCLMNIGVLYTTKGQFKQADEHYKKAKSIFENTNDSLGLAVLYLNLGVLKDEAKNFKEAMGLYELSMQISEDIGDYYGVAITKNNIAGIMMISGKSASQRNKLDSAKKYLDEAFEYCQESGDSSLILDVLYNYGEFYSTIGEDNKAIEYFLESYNLGSINEVYELQLVTSKRLSELYSKKNDFEDAFKYLNIHDSINSKINADEVVRQFALVNKQYEDEVRLKESALKEHELNTIQEKLINNRFLLSMVISGFIIILFFSILYYNRYQLAKKVKNELQITNEELSKVNRDFKQSLISKKEKEVLLKEIHHRVKNNLQIINSLLRFQAIQSPNNMSGVFQDLQNRISAMALLHDQLYLTNDLSTIDTKSYLSKLITNLNSVYNNNEDIKLDIEINVGKLDIDTLHPLGLIVNEIVSNSIKYAFEGVRNKTIYLNFNKTSSGLVLRIGDNGIGIRKMIPQIKYNSIGMDLIYNLSEQLNGKLIRKIDKGTHYTLTF